MWSYNEKVELGVSEIKEYPRFTLYQVFRKVGTIYVPIYKTTLTKEDLFFFLKKGYKLLD